MLRRRAWWNALNMSDCPSTTPQPTQKFLQSAEWDDQRHIIIADYNRMEGLSHLDVAELCSRYSCRVAAGYMQGYLYLLRVMSWVFGRDPVILYWSFVRAVDLVRPYGPLGREMGVRDRAIDVALEHADPALDKEILRDLVSVRWGFVLFGQTFTDKEQLLCIWDLIVSDRRYIGYIMGALLHVIRFDDADLMVRLSRTVDVQIDTIETTSKVIAAAHLIHNVHDTPAKRWSSLRKRFRPGTRK